GAPRSPLPKRRVAVRQAQAPAGAALSRRVAVALLAALAWASARADEYRASSYVFGTLVQITVLGADPVRARRAVGQVLIEFDRMHRDLHAWKGGELVALNEAIARGEPSIRTT